MFKIKKDRLGKFTRVNIINTQTREFVSVIPAAGGNINEIVLRRRGRKYSIIDRAKTDDELVENRGFKGAKLLPFPNRINRGQYHFEGKQYHLPINFGRHAIHGFVYDKNLSIKSKAIEGSYAYVELEYINDGALEGYPFKFAASIQYYLIKDSAFGCRTIVTNLDESTMPVGDGWHPYFKLNEKVDDLMIKIPSELRLEVDKQLIPTGRFISNNYSQPLRIGEMSLDTCFYIGDQDRPAVTKIHDPISDLTINIWQETGQEKYNYLQIFTPPSRDSIAIEPMTCAPDAFNNKMGLIVLQPKQALDVSFGVSLS